MTNSYLSDTSSLYKTSNIRFYGASPDIFETANPENKHLFLSVQHSSFGYESILENLYTRAGS